MKNCVSNTQLQPAFSGTLSTSDQVSDPLRIALSSLSVCLPSLEERVTIHIIIKLTYIAVSADVTPWDLKIMTMGHILNHSSGALVVPHTFGPLSLEEENAVWSLYDVISSMIILSLMEKILSWELQTVFLSSIIKWPKGIQNPQHTH